MAEMPDLCCFVESNMLDRVALNIRASEVDKFIVIMEVERTDKDWRSVCGGPSCHP
jgi:hypothetical protein